MAVPGQSPHHFGGGFCVLRGDVLLQGGLGVAHPPAVGTGEGLGLLHREVVPSVIQVWTREGHKLVGLSPQPI